MEARGLKKFLMKNKRLKLLAFLFATALWFFVAGQTGTEVAFLVPLGFKGIPKNMAITSAPQGEVEVRFTGPKFVVQNMTPSQVMVELDLSKAAEGLHTYRLLPEHVNAPTGVKVTRLRPSTVDIEMERVLRVALPVRPRLAGSPAKGYRVSYVTVTPEVVEAAGLKEDLDPLSSILTEPIDITGMDASRNFAARLDVSEMDLMDLSIDKVNILVKIEKIERER